MMTIREDAGASLQGAIDGTNAKYTTTYAMRLDRVIDVYVNGLCRMAALDNGYILQDAHTVIMREVLEEGDTLSVRYNCNPPQVGVAEAQANQLIVESDDEPCALHVSEQDEPETFQATILAC